MLKILTFENKNCVEKREKTNFVISWWFCDYTCFYSFRENGYTTPYPYPYIMYN